MLRRPPRSTRTDTLFPYTTLFRSMTAEEKAQWGLPADVAYKMGPDGPVAIGGQDIHIKQGRPVPDSTAKRVESAVDQRESLNRALRNFKSDFAGNTVTGGLENWLQGKFGTGRSEERSEGKEGGR